MPLGIPTAKRRRAKRRKRDDDGDGAVGGGIIDAENDDEGDATVVGDVPFPSPFPSLAVVVFTVVVFTVILRVDVVSIVGSAPMATARTNE